MIKIHSSLKDFKVTNFLFALFMVFSFVLCLDEAALAGDFKHEPSSGDTDPGPAGHVPDSARETPEERAEKAAEALREADLKPEEAVESLNLKIGIRNRAEEKEEARKAAAEDLEKLKREVEEREREAREAREANEEGEEGSRDSGGGGSDGVPDGEVMTARGRAAMELIDEYLYGNYLTGVALRKQIADAEFNIMVLKMFLKIPPYNL